MAAASLVVKSLRRNLVGSMLVIALLAGAAGGLATGLLDGADRTPPTEKPGARVQRHPRALVAERPQGIGDTAPDPARDPREIRAHRPAA